MIIKLAFMEGVRSFLHTPSGKSTAIGAALGATAGAIHRKDNRTHGAMVGGMLGGIGGLAAYETGLVSYLHNKLRRTPKVINAEGKLK
jgi:hypothetical protein